MRDRKECCPTKEEKQYYFSCRDSLKTRFSVLWLCELFGIARSGYYKCLKRKGTLNRYQVQQASLDSLVYEIHNRHPSLGYRSIKAMILLNTGWKVCRLSVLKSMQRLGFRSRARKKKYNFNKGFEHKIFPNILARNFRSTRPFEKVATDITQLRHKDKRYYLACYLDMFNNEVLAWDVKEREDNFLILKLLEKLLKNKRMNTASPLVLHSDQGAQYSSLSYISLLERYTVKQSMSRAGNPRDNAVMESFFGWFKHTLQDFNYSKCDNLVATIGQAVNFHNKHRPSYSLKY